MNDQEIRQIIDNLTAQAEQARIKFLSLTQTDVDRVIKNMAMAGLDHHMELAKAAVEETGRGVLEDKSVKNIFATEEVYHSIKYHKTVGLIHENDEEDYEEYAEPVGIVAGITPVTNPTSTVMFKALICMKTRNPVIFSFHPASQRCSVMAARLMLDAAVAAGAPAHCISWIDPPSVEATNWLMNHPQVSLVLATGGSAMVQSAYSTGKPALGVGPGNVPCYVEKTADLQRAVTDLIMSKTFDNGMICASEQAVILDQDIAEDFINLLKANRCYFLNDQEIKLVESLTTDEGTCSLNGEIVGRSAFAIAQMAGFAVPPDTKILIARLAGVGPDYPLSREKLSPVLALYIEAGPDEAIKRAEEMLEYGGLGHSAVIHSQDESVISRYAKRMKAGRVIVNSPASQGAIGDLYNTNMPSLTLGCGSMGGNSTTSNVSATNLINVKRVAKRRVKMQWFRLPERIYFESGSISYLTQLPNINRAIIVTDQVMTDLGYVDKVIYHLNKRLNNTAIEVFSDVEPDPSVETVLRGRDMFNQFQPDTIIALGGGSVMDAAKGMWLFYEHPDVEFGSLRLKFLDIRKRTYKFPQLGRKARLVAIPTTSGTGSEVTAFTVITDKNKQTKYPLTDYELTPDVAIIDVDLVMSVPPRITADTGMDVLTHAVEAYVSVMASDYTDGLALKAIELVFRYLPRAYANGADREAREKMHNASTIAGMAFTNAFLGITHALAHQLGGEFHVPHGRANAVLLPLVIRYNSQVPTKFASWPKYEYFQAPQKYQEIARYLGLAADTPAAGVVSLINAIQDLLVRLDMPLTIADCGVDEADYLRRIPVLAEKAFADQTSITNPRTPLIHELAGLYRAAYRGRWEETEFTAPAVEIPPGLIEPCPEIQPSGFLH